MEEVVNSSPLISGEKERNHGVDLLRMVAMFMVVVYCIVTYGGILGAQAVDSFGYVLLNCLSAFVFCAVNVFAAISGYANVKNSFKLRRVIKLWVRVFAYIILINLGYMVYLLIAGKSFTFKSFIKASLPILNDRYWYFTAYFVLCFFMPFFNILVDKMSRKQHKILIIVVLFFASVLSSIIGVLSNFSDMRTSISIHNGYNFPWLAAMYFVGAYFAKYGFLKMSKIKLALIYLASSLLIFMSEIIFSLLTPLVFGEVRYVKMFTVYPSIFNVLSAVVLLNLFGKINFGEGETAGKKFVRFFAPACFGVYLIVANPFVKAILLVRLEVIAGLTPWAYIPVILGLAAVIFFVCALVDKLRALVFKYARIDALCDIIGNGVQKKFCGFIDKRTEEK